MMNNVNIDQVLNQMRAISQRSQLGESQSAQSANATDFSKVLAESINQVNDIQKNASELKTAYEAADPSVDLPEVMVAVQKASLSFEAVTEVRNKLLNAYQEVMNMQV